MSHVPREGQSAERRDCGGYNRNFHPNPNDQCRNHDVDSRRSGDLTRPRNPDLPPTHASRDSPTRKLQWGMPEEVSIIESTPMPGTSGPHVTPPYASASSSATLKPWSPIKGRVLEWSDLWSDLLYIGLCICWLVCKFRSWQSPSDW